MAKKKRLFYQQIKDLENVTELTHSSPELLRGKWQSDVFQSTDPICLELACGKGEYSVKLAQMLPRRNIIGVDIKGDRIARGAALAADIGLSNVHFLRIQIEDLADYFDAGEISEIWITFPDPHIRNAHAKKRLTSPRFLSIYTQILAPGSVIHLKTDSMLLYDYTIDTIREGGHELLMYSTDVYRDDRFNDSPVTVVQTYYEEMYRTDGIPIKYLKFRLTSDERAG